MLVTLTKFHILNKYLMINFSIQKLHTFKRKLYNKNLYLLLKNFG